MRSDTRRSGPQSQEYVDWDTVDKKTHKGEGGGYNDNL